MITDVSDEIATLAWRVVRWPIAPRGAARGRTERASVIVELVTARGVRGLGEAAPLPGMSPPSDTVEAVVAQLEQLARGSLAWNTCWSWIHVQEDMAQLRAAYAPGDELRIALTLLRTLPSLVFALDTALHTITALHNGATLADSFQDLGGPSQPFAAVVDDVADARRADARGIRCAKIKVGADLEADLARVREISEEAPALRLRLDANRAWRRADVPAILARFVRLGAAIDFVEEPCVAAHELLGAALPLPLALDESLATLDNDALNVAAASPSLAAFVVKPTLHGGLQRVQWLVDIADTYHKQTIVSHALEGPIGTAACAELSRGLHNWFDTGAPGLAPHPGLDGWRLAVPQLSASEVIAAGLPGLGFGALDLDGVVRAAP